jgi:predicted TIM-barrel fold metal-dependent hydrolase
MSKKHIAATVKTGKMAGAVALKIHPRLQRTNLEANKVHYLVHLAEELDLPVIICSFNDGSWGRFGLTNDQFLKLADNFPDVKFLWAHAGGHNVLDFMFMARRTSNVYLDSSFTQSYFFKGSVLEDLNYASESLPNRFMFGTDFEGVAYPGTVKKNVDYYLQQNKNRDLFFEKNYKKFLGIDE